MNIVKIDCQKIIDWDSFHKEFSEKFGFPDFYGNNMNAWIDCMTSLDAPEDGMTNIHAEKLNVITLQLENVNDLANQYPELYNAIVECSAFVNWRRMDNGNQPPVLALSFYKTNN
jgi:RNAse (barnase) inhibitor barstar